MTSVRRFIKLSRNARKECLDPQRAFLECGVLDGDPVAIKVASRILLRRYLYNRIISRRYA